MLFVSVGKVNKEWNGQDKDGALYLRPLFTPARRPTWQIAPGNGNRVGWLHIWFYKSVRRSKCFSLTTCITWLRRVRNIKINYNSAVDMLPASVGLIMHRITVYTIFLCSIVSVPRFFAFMFVFFWFFGHVLFTSVQNTLHTWSHRLNLTFANSHPHEYPVHAYMQIVCICI